MNNSSVINSNSSEKEDLVNEPVCICVHTKCDSLSFLPMFGKGNFNLDNTTGITIRDTRGLIATKYNASKFISHIEILTQDDVLEVICGKVNTIYPRQVIAILMNQEYMMKIDVFTESVKSRVSTVSKQVLSLRIHTNYRIIDVFKNFTANVTSYKPPTGYYISGIMGEKRNLEHSTLAFRCSPLTSFNTRCCVKPIVCPKVKMIDEICDASVSIKESSNAGFVKAIVLTCSDMDSSSIINVRVLSPYNFDQLKQIENYMQISPISSNEMLFVLLDGEHIKRVDTVETQDSEFKKRLIQLRFHTNLRQTPWYGKIGEFDERMVVGSHKTFVKTFQVQGEEYICGFYTTSLGFGCYRHSAPTV